MFYRIRDFYLDLKYYFKNIIKWSSTLWHIRDWDAQYLYLLIETHLNNMYKTIGKYGCHADKESVLSQIEFARKLAKDLGENNYLLSELKTVEEEFGEIKNVLTPHPTTKGVFTWNFEMTDNHRLAWDNARKVAIENYERDKAMLFDYIKKNIEGWWD